MRQADNGRSRTNKPRSVLWACLGLALAARLSVAWTGNFTIHPDEIMQVLEQAHRLVHGAGMIPWEFEQGTRSWLLPGAMAGLLWVARLLGLDRPTEYIPFAKAVLCICSLSVPYAMYSYARRQWSQKAGTVALCLGAFWWELVMLAHKPLQELVATYVLVWALALYVAPPSAARAVSGGIASAVAAALRLQYAPAVAVLMIFVWRNWPAGVRRSWFLAAAVSLVLVGLFDFATWGGLWHSYIANVRLNVFEGVADVFGKAGLWFYLKHLTHASLGCFVVALAVACRVHRRHWELLALLAVTLAAHMLIGHKEYRFVVLVVVLWLLMFAQMTAALLDRKNGKVLRHRLAWGLPIVWAAASVLGIANRIPHQERLHFVFGRPVTDYFAPRPDLQAYLFLSGQPDLTGVLDLNSKAWTNSGGYYYLHKGVPLYHARLFQRVIDEPLSEASARKYVSHVITKDAQKSLPGFNPIAKFDGTTVWRVAHPQQRFVWADYAPRMSAPQPHEVLTLVRQ